MCCRKFLLIFLHRTFLFSLKTFCYFLWQQQMVTKQESRFNSLPMCVCICQNLLHHIIYEKKKNKSLYIMWPSGRHLQCLSRNWNSQDIWAQSQQTNIFLSKVFIHIDSYGRCLEWNSMNFPYAVIESLYILQHSFSNDQGPWFNHNPHASRL